MFWGFGRPLGTLGGSYSIVVDTDPKFCHVPKLEIIYDFEDLSTEKEE